MSQSLINYLTRPDLAPPLAEAEAQSLANGSLRAWTKLQVYPQSITAAHHSLFFLGQREFEKFLGVVSTESEIGTAFEGQSQTITQDETDLTLTIAPTTATNAAALRALLPFLVAHPLGLQKSAGCGDRLGLATPGHLRAFRSTFEAAAPSKMVPILAQQSIRENIRTGRSPQEVMDDAMWGVFQAGWRDGFGADADHLKTTADIDICAAAGYTFYTIDPGEYVNDAANEATMGELQEMVEALPWTVLDSDPADLSACLVDQTIDLGEFSFTFSQETLFRAAAKYGQAVAQTVSMYRYLVEAMGDRPFELEMSVDETETVTSLAEHVYIVNELRRLRVKWVSLAPRYVGAFEKGADYIGDLAEFEQSFRQHLAVAQAFGPYKLSLHSGSDKFSIYPIAARVAGELVHLKTAGTSYLEALRAIAMHNAALFREIVAFALARYPTDRASYHVSAEVDKVPDYVAWPDGRLINLLDDFDAREILHVTFGSVLNHTPFRQPFFDTLRQNEETYSQMLEAHFNKHFAPFRITESSLD